jgi:hypothetical protein
MFLSVIVRRLLLPLLLLLRLARAPQHKRVENMYDLALLGLPLVHPVFYCILWMIRTPTT